MKKNGELTWINPGAIILFLLICCAHQQGPPGGPEDKEPPFIVMRKPENLSTNVKLTESLELKWSEWINRKSFEKGFLMNPPVLGEPRFKWSGARVKITFDSLYSDNMTYVISISSTIKDLRNVPIEEPIIWTFATGDSLSTGSISGRVLGNFASGRVATNLLVSAYRMQEDSAFLPHNKRCDYLVSASKDGDFRFKYMNEGVYRLFAFFDSNNDKKFQFGREMLAIPPYDCPTGSDSAQSGSRIILQLANHDTMPPAIKKVTGTSPRTCKIEFDREFKKDALGKIEAYRIYSKSDSSEKELPVHKVCLGPGPNEVLLLTGSQKYSKFYHLRVKDLVDMNGRSISAGKDSAVFFSAASRDTTPPKIAQTVPRNRQRDVLMTDSIKLQLVEPINLRQLRNAYTLADTNDNPIRCRFIASDLCNIKVVPNAPLKEGTIYVFSIFAGGLMDVFRNTNKDTIEHRFTTIMRDDLTKKVTGRIQSRDNNPTVLTFEHLDSRRLFSFTFDSNDYELADLPKGKYLLRGFKDSNKNGRADLGSLVPFNFSEQFVAYPDTLTFFGRWEHENIDLKFAR